MEQQTVSPWNSNSRKYAKLDTILLLLLLFWFTYCICSSTVCVPLLLYSFSAWNSSNYCMFTSSQFFFFNCSVMTLFFMCELFAKRLAVLSCCRVSRRLLWSHLSKHSVEHKIASLTSLPFCWRSLSCRFYSFDVRHLIHGFRFDPL